MKCNCPNCGRKIETTIAEARRLGGHLVCPQCLTQVDVDVPPAAPSRQSAQKSGAASSQSSYCPQCGSRIKASDEFCPKCGTSLGSAKRRSADVPPPYRRTSPARSVSASRPVPTRQPSQSSTSRPARQQRQPSKQQKSGGPIGGLGCLWRTVLLVVAAFALYVITGILLQ